MNPIRGYSLALAILLSLMAFPSADRIHASRSRISFDADRLKDVYDSNVSAVVLIRAEGNGSSNNAKPTKSDWDQNEFRLLVHTYYTLYPTELAQITKQGTGFIITPSGEILTNYHIIEGTSTISVTLKNRDFYIASVIGTDPSHDLALLKIISKDNTDFPTLHFGNSNAITVSDNIAIIGNPFGLRWTLSKGIISGLDRLLNFLHPAPLIQIQSAVNPGNSGGPLLNVSGEVIGIVHSIMLQGDGIGFVIPINIAKERLPLLRNPPHKPKDDSR